MNRPPRPAVEAAIRAAGGNLTATAASLKCSRQTLYTWIYQLGLERLAGVTLKAKRPAAPTSETALPRAVTLKLPGELHRWVRIHGIRTDRSASDVAAEALELLRAVVEDGK